MTSEAQLPLPLGEQAVPPEKIDITEVDTIAQLASVASTCTRCSLRAGCRQVVVHDGSPTSRLMFVGEGPGADEDRLGRPFVGRAGQLLDRALAAIGISRDEVYITNIVKCRPPGNRVPTPAEMAACWPYLQRQIELINPEFVVCLGATAARGLVDPKASVTRWRGRWIPHAGRRYMITFHPAALLRDPSKKVPAWEDFKMIQQAWQEG